MKSADAKVLCEKLMHADAEAEVIALLKEAGYWDDATCWRFYGDQEENYSTVGNQQSRAEQALIEKAMNSIDTKLIAAARIAGVPLNGSEAPQSVFEARDLFFGGEIQNIEKLSKSITIAATGKKTRPSITIVDGDVPLIVATGGGARDVTRPSCSRQRQCSSQAYPMQP